MKKFNYETLVNDTNDIKAEYGILEQHEFTKRLAHKGWTVTRYREIFIDIKDFQTFIKENSITA